MLIFKSIGVDKKDRFKDILVVGRKYSAAFPFRSVGKKLFAFTGENSRATKHNAGNLNSSL